MMGRFYSMRSQANTKQGADFESLNTLNSLSDPYALGREKTNYLKMNYRRIYGKDPVQKVMRYNGAYPQMQSEYNKTFN